MKRERSRKKILVFLKFFFTLTVIGGGFYLLKRIPEIIVISEISCASQYGPCNKKIASYLEGFKQTKLSKAKSKIRHYLEESISVEQFLIQFRFPSRLQIDLVENKPVFALKRDDGPGNALIDKKGVVIGSSESTNLPTLKIFSELPVVGEKVPDKTLFALDLIYDIYESFSINEGSILKETLVVKFPRGPEVIFPLEGDRQVLLGSLNLIISRLNAIREESRIENVGGIQTIDLRFKNPVIK